MYIKYIKTISELYMQGGHQTGKQGKSQEISLLLCAKVREIIKSLRERFKGYFTFYIFYLFKG